MTARSFFYFLAALALLASCSSTPPSGDFVFTEVTLRSEPSRATTLRFIPGTRELLIARITGEIEHHRLDLDGASTTYLGELTVPGVYESLDCGLISLAFDPDFATNRMIFVGHCTDTWHSAIGRMTLATSGDAIDYDAVPDTYVEILELGDLRAMQPWHNVGALFFDAEGALLALFGDKTIASRAQDLQGALGGIVRLFPSRTPGVGGYEPPDTPAFSAPNASPIRFAAGFRSPWTGFVDDEGRIVVGDVGSSEVEEIDIVTAPGQNFGWPRAEGPCTDEGDAQDHQDGCDRFVDPVRHWTRSESHPFVLDDPDAVLDWPRVAWAAPASRPELPDPYGGRLDGSILYGDMCVGFVRRMRLDARGALVDDAPIGHLANATGWDVGPDGHVYAITFADRCTTSPDATYGRAQLFRLEAR